MDEKYLMEIYNTHGGQQRFGAYQNFYNKVQNDPEYRAKLHDFLSGRNSTEKSYSDWESSIKKKEPTGQNYGSGSNQTQQSNGSKPSQEDSGFDGFKWAKEKAEKGKASLQPESYSEAIKQAEAGKKPTSELGLEGVLDIKGPDITAVSESTKPFINPQFNIVTSKKETLPSTETSLKYLPTKEEKILIRRENENKKKQEIEDRRIENSEYNRANDEFFNTYFSSGIENYDSELAKLEADKQLGVYNGYEENYKNRKSELNAARGNAYNQILDKYINDILKNDNNKDFLEIKERYDGIMNDIRKAGFNSFEELQSKYGDVPIESGDPSDSPIFDVVDKADQRFLRQLRIDAINQLEVPDPNRENKYIEGLGYMNKSIDAVSKFHKQAQPIYADYDNLMKDINTFEADFKSGKYGEKEANDIKNSLQSREKEILTRTNQLKKESGLTDYDIARYELAGKKQFVLGSNYENSFSSLKQIDKVQAEEIADRQRWVTENPVLGTIAYFIPAAYQSFSNATVLETARFAKPISELAGFEGYGWTDALYYGVTEYQKDRDYLYGYTGQDIDGDGQVDDLPGFAKYANILAQGLGSVASFAIPGTYAKNLFPGLGAGAKAGRFATNWTGAFLMSEGPAYEEAKRAGLSNEEAARSATLIAALQATAEQIVPDIKYLDPSLTKAGFISLIKAGYTGNELFKKGMSYLYDYSKSVSKSSLKEAGEEIVGQLGTDLGKETTNALYTNSNNYNLSSFSNPDYSTKVYDDAWQMKNYVDAGIGGLLTGGFLDGFRNATRVYTQNEMEALSYMGQNWKDILYNIERTESNGVNRGDDRFKQIEGELKGIGDLYSALKGTPGFSELTKANQDMVMSLAYRKRTLEDNAKKLGVTLPSVEESIKGIESRMNDYLTGKLDYGADKPVVYMDDKLAEIGVATVNVNPDGTYDIVPKDLPGLSKEEIIKNADSYIKNSLKDEGFQKIFLHPKTENYAIQESETGQVPVQPEAAVGEQVEEGTSQTEPQVTTEEGGKKEVGSDVLNRTLDVVDKVETKIEKSEPINDEDRKQAEDSLYELLNDIDSNPNLSTEQKAQMSLPIENKLQKIQDYELGTRTETRTTTQAVATGTTPKTQTKNERATIPLRTAAEESIDVTYNGRAGKLKIDQGNYVFVPNKIGRQQPKSVVIGEAAVTNRDSKFAGVESVNKKGVTTSAQITLPNGAVLGIMDTDLSIDVGIEIAKQEIGPAPQSLFDVVFDEIVTENNIEIPYTKAAPKVEPVVTEEVQEEPKVDEAAENELGQQLLEANEYNNKRKNELLKKNKGDSRLRNLISSAATAIDAIKKIYPDFKVYLHENTEEYELATQAQGIKLSEAGAMIYDENGNIVGIHVDLSKADGTTTPHELVHGILAKAFGDNQVLFNEFKDRVSKLLSSSTNAQLQAFANRYGDDVKSEEYLVQLAALLTDQRGKIEPGILQKLMSLINNFVSRITKGNIVPFKSTAKTQALVDFFNTVSNTMATGRNVSGLQSDIKNLQRQFGVERAGSRMQERVQPNQAEETGAKEQFRDTIPIPEYDLEQYIANTVSAKQQISNNRREEYKKLLEKKRPDLVEQGLIDDVISQVEKFGEENSKDGKGNPKLEKLAFHYINNSNLILPEDGYKVIEAERLATKNKIDPFSYKNPAELIQKFSVLEKEKPINPDTIKEFSNKKTIPGTNITIYNVDDTREGQASVRRIIDTHLGDKFNEWCILARIGGTLETAWGLWSGRYNKIPKKIAFENGRLISFCASATNNDEWWDKQDRPHSGVPSTKKLEDNKKQIVEYSEDGFIVNEGEVFRKTKNKEEYWYSNGVLRKETSIKDGIPNGIEKEYYKNGQLKSEMSYEDGMPNGVTKSYFENGQLQQEAFLNDADPVGLLLRYHKNGQLAEESNFDSNGDRNGVQKAYYENGQLAEEGMYSSGDKSGVQKEYYENGQLKSEMEYDGDTGEVYGLVSRYHENGQLEFQSYYSEDGREGVSVSYFDNGQVSEQTNYVNGEKNGLSETYYRNGQLESRGYYADDEIDGLNEVYYENGQLESEKYYVEGVIDGISKFYHENGQLESVMQWENGERNGTAKYYNEDGSLFAIKEYENDKLVFEDYPSNRISTTENQNEVLNRNRRAKQQIVGQRGVETANDKVAQKDLETAKLMASNNRPATDIKMATGWEMGADGQWRYEYPNVTLKDDLQDENDFRLVVKGYNQSQGISDRFNTKQPPIPLSEILNFGKIQEAYPYIDDLYFELDDSLQSEAYGQLDIGRGLVSLNPKIINDIGIDEVQKVLIHEIQHYIQEQEGFEKGGNVEMMEREIKQSQNAYKIPGLTLVGSTVEDTINYGVIDIKSMVESGISLNDIYNGNYDVSQYGNNPQALLKAVFRPDQIEKINDSDVDFAISKINEYALYSAAHKDYWSLVGETEARNAAKRSETPYLERLYGSTLESTEDVFRRDQIRKDGGRIFKEMDVISNKRGLARQRMEQQNRENFGELYVKAKEINDNFENIINQLGITKICGL